MNNSVVAPVGRHSMRMLRCEVSVDALCYRDRLIQKRVLIVDGAKGTTSHERCKKLFKHPKSKEWIVTSSAILIWISDVIMLSRCQSCSATSWSKTSQHRTKVGSDHVSRHTISPEL